MEEGLVNAGKIRKLLVKQAVDGFIQPVNDEYMSEYPPASNQRVAFVSGFQGSAGTVVVLKEKAGLFTDGRYTLQAKNEVDSAVFEQHNSGTLAPEVWVAENLPSGAKLGYDAKMYTASAVKRIEVVLAKKNIAFMPVGNLIDRVWEARPPQPATSVFIHDIKYAGESSADKRARIAAQVVKDGADAAVLATPDAVCWLLNVRGRDVESTPLVLSCAVIDREGKVQFFVDPARCDANVRAHLGNQVELVHPDNLAQQLAALGSQKKRVLCDPASVPVWFTQKLKDAGASIVEATDPCVLPKAMKNEVELQGIASAHIRDGVAIVKLLHWLGGAAQVTEMEVSDKLREFRALHPMFVEPSFATISGSGPNGAIVHYRVSEQSDRTLVRGELFLLDSGGQYPDGTTDITRTVVVGEPSEEHRDRFTRVLKGHIGIANAKFPEGTSGSQLDVLARQHLWQVGLDYDHGTGHGVGCFLGVHEGPQRISKRGGDAALRPGMIVSNEPGYYKTGAYGIRNENLVKVVRLEGASLGFETLTCAPIDTRLVMVEMLTQEEISWLNQYHEWVLHMLGESLSAPEKSWLETCCAAIG